MKELILQLVLEKRWCLCLMFGEILSWDMVIASAGALVERQKTGTSLLLLRKSIKDIRHTV